MNSEGTSTDFYAEGSSSSGTEINTRAAGSGEEPRYPTVEERENELLDDLRETIEPFIRRQMAEGKNPYRFVYAFGSANSTGYRSGANSDLGLLLKLIQEKQRTDDDSSMTYIYLFDTEYTEDGVRREVEAMNTLFGSPRREPRRQSFNWNAGREGNIREENYDNLIPNNGRRNNYFGGANAAVSLRQEPFPTETFFPARYSFGSRCTLFFLNSYVPSHCEAIRRGTYEGQQQVKELGFVGTALSCSPAPRSAFDYLQTLVQNLLLPEGELYLYNCAWVDAVEPGIGFYAGNAYFESFPEVLFLAFHDYSPKEIQRYILYNHYSNLFSGEEIVVRSTVERNNAREGHLRQVTVGPDTEFVRFRRREGGKRSTRRRKRNQKKSRKVKRR